VGHRSPDVNRSTPPPRRPARKGPRPPAAPPARTPGRPESTPEPPSTLARSPVHAECTNCAILGKWEPWRAWGDFNFGQVTCGRGIRGPRCLRRMAAMASLGRFQFWPGHLRTRNTRTAMFGANGGHGESGAIPCSARPLADRPLADAIFRADSAPRWTSRSSLISSDRSRSSPIRVIRLIRGQNPTCVFPVSGTGTYTAACPRSIPPFPKPAPAQFE